MEERKLRQINQTSSEEQISLSQDGPHQKPTTEV